MPTAGTDATTIRTVGAELQVNAKRDERLERIPGATYDPAKNTYRLPATSTTIHQLEPILGPIEDLTADPLALSLATAAKQHPDYHPTPSEPNLDAERGSEQPRLQLEPPTPTVRLPTGSCAARVDGALLLIESPYEAKQTLKAIPEARWNSRHRAWSYPSTIQHLAALKRALGDALRLDESSRVFRRLELLSQAAA